MCALGPVLVVGAGGQLGSAIVRAYSDRAVVAPRRSDFDLADVAAARQAVTQVAPAIVINCAAYNDVDGAEDRPADAFAVNAFAVRSLARAAADSGATFVHYSTDFVFDGEARAPYTEAMPPSPRSAYAMSKLVGEWFALEQARGYVLRVESLFGTPRGWTGRRGTLEGIVAGLEQGRTVKVFTDRVVTPSYMRDVAAATRHLIDTGAAPGLYHCVNSGQATWHDVAAATARLLGVAATLEPITTDRVTLKAPRPRFCALDNDKLAAAGFPMPPWEDAVARWIAARGPALSVE